jgi:hypothetical protein
VVYLDDGVAGVGDGRFGDDTDLDVSSAHSPDSFHFVCGVGGILGACNRARDMSRCVCCSLPVRAYLGKTAVMASEEYD